MIPQKSIYLIGEHISYYELTHNTISKEEKDVIKL